jgi:hypothetical protein
MIVKDFESLPMTLGCRHCCPPALLTCFVTVGGKMGGGEFERAICGAYDPETNTYYLQREVLDTRTIWTDPTDNVCAVPTTEEIDPPLAPGVENYSNPSAVLPGGTVRDNAQSNAEAAAASMEGWTVSGVFSAQVIYGHDGDVARAEAVVSPGYAWRVIGNSGYVRWHWVITRATEEFDSEVVISEGDEEYSWTPGEDIDQFIALPVAPEISLEWPPSSGPAENMAAVYWSLAVTSYTCEPL